MENEIAQSDTKAIAMGSEATPEIQPIEEGDSIRLPRISMIQGDRQEIRDKMCEAGDLINTVSKQVYGKSVTVVPLVQRPLTRIKWGERNSGGGILCISRNKLSPSGDPGDQHQSCSECPMARNYDRVVGCTGNYELIALVVNGDEPQGWEPVIITADYVKSSDRGVRDMLANIRFGYRKGIRMFHKPYILDSVYGTNKNGQGYYSFHCKPGNDNKSFESDKIGVLEMMMTSFVTSKIDSSGAHGEDSGEVNEGQEAPPENYS